MNEDLPSQMPPPPTPLPPPTTQIPRVFSVWGTVIFFGCSATSFASMIAYSVGWTPPWFIILPAFLYVFISSGFIAVGRMESNKDARLFIEAIKQRSEENRKRAMRKMN